MAFDMAINIKDIPGESATEGYKDHIDVLAWSWGLSQSGDMHTGGGGGAGKVNVQDLSFTKYVDKSTPKLQLACCEGKHVPEAVLKIRKAGGKQEDYMIITLTDLLVSSVSTGGSGGEDRLTENVTLNFAKVKVEYKIQDEKGGTKAGGDYTWDIKKAKKG